jgi:hypothetical protein
MKVISLLLTLLIVAPYAKAKIDDIDDVLNANEESTKEMLRGTVLDLGGTERQKNTNNKPVITNDGISDSDYDRIFLDDVAYCLPLQKGEPLEDEEESSDGDRKLQSISTRYVLLCKNSDCRGGHVYAGPGYYPTMPWQIGNDALTRVYIPARWSFQYFEHTYYSGWTETYFNAYSAINLDMAGFNDAVSSFIIRKY